MQMNPMDPEPSGHDGTGDGSPDYQNEDPSLNRTGRFLGGLVADIRRKALWYRSDFKDGLHAQCFTSAFLVYIGCLTTMIQFGGLLGSLTDNNIGLTECLVGGAICGVTYHLLCGQPLTILSSTGPILVFEGIVYKICMRFGWYYLGFRFWIGFWIFVIFFFFVALDLSSVMRYVTRFTQDVFLTVLAFAFIHGAFTNQFQQMGYWNNMRELDKDCSCQFSSNVTGSVTESDFVSVSEDVTTSSNWTRELDFVSTIGDCRRMGGRLDGQGCWMQMYHPAFLFSLFLFFGTFLLLLLLKLLKHSRFLPFRIRAGIGDLAIFAVVLLMFLIDRVVGMRTVKLQIPSALKITGQNRGWIINPLVNPWLTILYAIPPAILAAILMFIDQHIPTVIIATCKERKLKKGSGFNLDLMVIALQVFLCSVFGCPWFVGATVLSVNHIHSLSMESAPCVAGERSVFLGIREQRVTGILVSLLIGGSVYGAEALKFVPMSVLYGVLLYMGVASLQGVQFVKRILFFLKRRRCVPSYPPFLPRVPLGRVCLFTFIQVVCFIASCILKQLQVLNLLFPLTVIVLCVVRKVLEKLFTYEELLYLDDILPGSKRKTTEIAPRTEDTGTLEPQTQAACVMPTVPDVTICEFPPPLSPPPPPSYDMVMRQMN